MDDRLKRIKAKFDAEDAQLIQYAFDFAEKQHAGQARVSGEPYVNHPLSVAEILADLDMDASCISAALLHDVLEDTDCTELEFKKRFGADICLLVSGVTKLSRIKYTSAEDAQAENYRKLFFAIVQDVRVIFIKLADRLHNMRTLEPLRPEKRIRIAKETLDIYAPMAGRLGMATIKSELEDLCMRYLFPEAFEELNRTLDKTRGERMGFVMRIATELEVDLAELNIKGEVRGRPKHLYSVYKKMQAQEKTLEQIYDLIAVRVIVETVRDCYTVLGIIHSKWKPVPGRFKDYIAMPKPNLYQSLHTTVVTGFGQVFEIQIRTYEMNRTAEYGIAAHWVYKEKGSVKATGFDEKLGWLRDVVEMDDVVKDSSEYIHNVKENIISDEIYVFTPKGAVLGLPKGATCVDFAYKVHSEVGNKCAGAKVNNRMVPLNTVLENGDVVEIVTASAIKGPSRDWLKFVVTTQAKSRIRAFFKKKMLAENIKTGKDMLEREAKRRGYHLSALVGMQEILDKLFARYSLASIDDMYAAVGYGGLTTNQVLIKLIDAYKKEQVLNHVPEIAPETTDTFTAIRRKTSGGVLIEGYDDFLIKLAKCCNPVPGDPIVGYAGRGTGVSVHRTDCSNIRSMEAERLMGAKWAESDSSTFITQLRVECVDRNGFLNELISLVTQQGYNISSVEAHVKHTQGTAVILLGIQIKNTVDVEYITKKIESLPDVVSVKRNY